MYHHGRKTQRPHKILTAVELVQGVGAAAQGQRVRAGGRLEDAAFLGTAELARYRTDGKERTTELLEIDLAAVLRGDAAADVLLQSFDTLTIKELPEWSLREQVTLTGEVRCVVVPSPS